MEEFREGAALTIPPRKLHRLLGFLEVRPRHHEFRDAVLHRPFDHTVEVVFVRLLAVVVTVENGVGEVDADLH